jgi:hypothetical protein
VSDGSFKGCEKVANLSDATRSIAQRKEKHTKCSRSFKFGAYDRKDEDRKKVIRAEG